MNCKCGELFCPFCNTAIHPLSKIQAKIVKLIAEEKPLKAISPMLSLPRSTLQWHISRIKNLIGAKNVQGMVRFAVRAGMFPEIFKVAKHNRKRHYNKERMRRLRKENPELERAKTLRYVREYRARKNQERVAA